MAIMAIMCWLARISCIFKGKQSQLQGLDRVEGFSKLDISTFYFNLLIVKLTLNSQTAVYIANIKK